jgi:beta-lactamase superfamily II metal-dependent hydrolase
MEKFAPGRVFTSAHSSRSPTYREALRKLEALGERWVQAEAGERIGRWEVLHPGTRRFSRADDNAMVLRGEIRGWRIIFIGDLGRDGQRALLRSGQELAADVAILGTPDSGEGWMDELVERIGARVVILGATRPHARKPGATRYVREPEAIFDVENEAAVKIEFASKECAISSMNGKRHVLRK